jgi:hypothetical protein
MNLGKEILFFFSALGAFNGLILSCYFFFFIRKKQLSNYFLGLLLDGCANGLDFLYRR